MTQGAAKHSDNVTIRHMLLCSSYMFIVLHPLLALYGYTFIAFIRDRPANLQIFDFQMIPTPIEVCGTRALSFQESFENVFIVGGNRTRSMAT